MKRIFATLTCFISIIAAPVMGRVVRDVKYYLPEDYPPALIPPNTGHWFVETDTSHLNRWTETSVRFATNSTPEEITSFFKNIENWEVVYSAVDSSRGTQINIALEPTDSSSENQAVVDIKVSREEGDPESEPYAPNLITTIEVRYGPNLMLAYPMYFSSRPILEIDGAAYTWLPEEFPTGLIYPNAVLVYDYQIAAVEPAISVQFMSRDSVSQILTFFEAFDTDGWDHHQSTEFHPANYDYDYYYVYLTTPEGLDVRVEILPVREDDGNQHTKIVIGYDVSQAKPKENQW